MIGRGVIFHMQLFLLVLLLESVAPSSLPLSELSSLLYLQCTIMMPEKQFPILVEKKGKVELRNNELIPENTTAGFICSKSASNRIRIWNSGSHFRDYLINVKSLFTLENYVNDFLTRMTARPPKTFDHSTMLMVLKDIMLFSLALEQSGKPSDSKCLAVKILIKLTSCNLLPNVPIGSNVNFHETPTTLMPYTPSVTPLGILNAIRMVRMSEESNSLRSKFDTTKIMQLIVQEHEELNTPWNIKTFNSLRNEPWIKTYLARRMSVVVLRAFPSIIPNGVGLLPILLLDESRGLQKSLLYNSLLVIDQMSFQLNYVKLGGASEESILLQYLDLTGDEEDIKLYAEAFLEIWKELVELGLSNILHYDPDANFQNVVLAKIRIARIHFLLQREGGKAYHELIALDKLEALF